MDKESAETITIVPVRMDFVFEKVKVDEENGIVTGMMIPHPDRYKEIEENGKSYWLDIYLKHLIPKDEMLVSLAEQMKGLPIYALSPSVESTPDYAENRKTDLKSEFAHGKYISPKEKAIPHRNLEILDEERLIAFISVDICESTALRQKHAESFDKAYNIFLRELGTLVAQFNGTLLKTTGDGFIAYIDHPSFTRQADNIIDLGISMIVVLRDSLNPNFLENDMPPLEIRVGAELGPARINVQHIPATGFKSLDVASDALNKSVKLENAANKGEFLIGMGLFQTAHVQWLKRTTEIEFDSKMFGDSSYRVFRVN